MLHNKASQDDFKYLEIIYLIDNGLGQWRIYLLPVFFVLLSELCNCYSANQNAVLCTHKKGKKWYDYQ